MKVSPREKLRLKLQTEVDALKTPAERNILGQFATPTELAHDILKVAKTLLPSHTKVRFLDPAFGTGSFYSALLDVFSEHRIGLAQGFEIDPLYSQVAERLWQISGLRLSQEDFTALRPPENDDEKFNLVICNPPYVRHHHIPGKQKVRLRDTIENKTGSRLSGLAGLYCYFLLLSVGWMSKDGLAGWLIPSEFMDVNYGRHIKKFLLDRVSLLRIHRFEPVKVQFGDALVSSAVVWFRNTPPLKTFKVTFSFDGNLIAPSLSKSIPKETLEQEPKWTRFPISEPRRQVSQPVLSDFFKVKRGLATGNNRYFILSPEQIEKKRLPMECLRPILPSPRFLTTDEIQSKKNGIPKIENSLFLLDCDLQEEEIKARYPSLFAYLQEGRKIGVTKTYLCSKRSPWYSQEERPASRFLCTYIGRSDNGHRKPFRFILNHSKATVTNSYLILYPKPEVAKAMKDRPALMHKIWEALKSISPEKMLEEGRVYGGGLYKIEPGELANVPVHALKRVLTSHKSS
jgi:adenine-specific DNA-methyltransferase